MKIILLVDDDEEDHETISQAFHAIDPSAHCLCYRDCGEAISQLTGHTIPQVRCVLLDIHMPRMGGIECLKALKNLPGLADVDIIMISSQFRDGDLDELCRHGAKALCVKPNSWQGYKSMAQILLAGEIARGVMIRY